MYAVCRKVDKIVRMTRKNLVFLDEKWFYTTFRKKIKILPQASFETLKDAFVDIPKICRWYFPCKVMFMGIVCPPKDGQNINGKVLLKQVSKKVELKQALYNHNFVSGYKLNHKLKAGEWRSLYQNDFPLSIYDFLSLIQDTYQVDNTTVDNLICAYHTHYIVKKAGQIERKLAILTLYMKVPVLGSRKIKDLKIKW